MDKLVRKIEVPLAKNIVKKAGLYLVPKERLGELADVIESPASDLFCVKTPEGREVLVPDVDEFIGHIDEEGVFLCPIPGMFDDGAEVIPGGDTAGDGDEI